MGQIQYDKKTYNPGDIIALQGENFREIRLINSGTAEILYCPDRTEELSQQEVIGMSRRIGLINGKEFVGVTNLINEGPQTITARAITTCEAMTVAVPQTTDEIVEFFRMNAGLALNVLNGIKEIVQKQINNMKKYARMAGDMQKVSDNLMLLYSHINKKDTPLMKRFHANGGEIDSSLTPSFLLEDFSQALNTNYNMLAFDPVEHYDFNRLDFYNNLIKSKPEAFGALIFANPKIYTFIYRELAAIVDEINDETAKCCKQIDQTFTAFFDDDQSAFNKICDCGDKVSKIGGPGLNNAIVSLCRNMEKNYAQLTGSEHISPTDKYTKLVKNAVQVESAATTQTAANSTGAYKKKLKGSVQKILGFSTLTKDRKDSVTKAIKNLKNINYQDPTGKESRLIIRKMQEEFFFLYNNSLQNIFEKNLMDSIPLEVSLFLYFGFADETLITEEQAEFLVNSVPFLRKPYNGKVKIITLVDYLRLIYDGTEQPSMSETGEIFS
ncbi:MAG: cyclic nucleotide-binding domain-containing protein, partial [Spirochaetales bacterium]|nr:cyclic nucleotide-binding domain-containing protein [Spirochaetales bacterium]